MSPSGVLAAPPEGHLSCQQPWDTQHVCTSVTQFYRQRPIALAWNQADYLPPITRAWGKYFHISNKEACSPSHFSLFTVPAHYDQPASA
jgi:hypothetical protein